MHISLSDGGSDMMRPYRRSRQVMLGQLPEVIGSETAVLSDSANRYWLGVGIGLSVFVITRLLDKALGLSR